MSKNDDRIVQLQKAVETKKALLATKSDKFAPTTTMSINFNGAQVNIHTLNGEQLVLLLCQLKALEVGATAVALSAKDVVISGFSIDAWMADISDKLAVQAIKEEKAQLAKMETKLKGLLSSDKKTELELDELEALL